MELQLSGTSRGSAEAGINQNNGYARRKGATVTLLEYLNRLTENGTKINLPKKTKSKEYTTVEGDPKLGKQVKVVMIKQGSLNSRQIDEQILSRVTWTAFNACTPYQFYRHVINVVPKDFRNGDYESEAYTNLVSDIVLEIANEMARTAYDERWSKSASTIITMLQTRVESWQKRFDASIEDNCEKLEVTIKV